MAVVAVAAGVVTGAALTGVTAVAELAALIALAAMAAVARAEVAISTKNI